MNPGLGSLLALVAAVGALLAAALGYLAGTELPRPPIGTYESSDIAVMSVLVVVAPLAYLALPRPVVAGVFGLVVFAAVQLTLAPRFGGRGAAAAAALLCTATALAWLAHRAALTEALNDVVLAIAVIGVANLWVQSGMRASHVTAFAAVLTGYDLAATGLTSVMSRFAAQIQGMAFAPQLILSTGRAPVGIGLGDLLMLLLFPLAAAKAFGRLAGAVAAVAAVAVTGLAALLLRLGAFGTEVPLLTLLGPVICAQYVFWRRAGYRERTVAQWRAGAPARAAEPDTVSTLQAAWELAVPARYDDGTWVAIAGGRVVGSGDSMGLARKSARVNGHEGVPIVKEV